MSVPKEVLDLVERFGQHLDDYRNGRYTETQVRRDYIDPLFKALGWDVDNSQGLAEAYRDVIHEDIVKVGGNTKAPDYSFRVGGTRKFFVEAKKPSVYIKGEPEPAFQVRRYAWSGKLPLSILTDFEEFAVYDCRIRPSKSDKSDKARIHYWTYTEYADKWDEIAAVFSKDAVLKGSFDKYAVAVKGKKGTAEVDAAFLDEIESWREHLAKNIAVRNPELSQKALNYAVQQTIDRIIFLRICEDRGIEPYGQLQALQNGANIYKRLTELFRKADERYNSGLFHFQDEKDSFEPPDRLTLKLDIDDKPLKEIFQHLYYPDSPYEFSVLGADILGSVYEQFLGKVIRLTEGHHAKIEEKPEVKKAGGVYYTPTYIVDYIVKHTVGNLVEGKTPKQVETLRILDPACGSGSFLIGAYQYLLDWHRDWYEKDGAEKHAKGKQPKLYQGKGGVWRLTTNERKRILTNNIYGVDIDSQAVEVTKLSLLLKVLEGESDQTLQTQLFHERVLPDLGRNIKCGNSLIGPDFYEQQSLSLDDIERARINVFDWQKEFSEIMKSGGFDAVIGNPPYIRIQVMKEWAPQEVEYYKDHYVAASKGNYDIYVVFVEKGLNLLNKTGRLGFILPNKFFNAQYGEPLRGLIAKGRHLAEVVHFGDQQVFDGATTYTCLMFLDRDGGTSCEFRKIDDLAAWRTQGMGTVARVAANTITTEEWNFAAGVGAETLRRVHAMSTKLGDVAHIFQGLVTGADKVFVVSTDADIEEGLTKPFLLTGGLTAYAPPTPSARIIFPYEIKNGRAELIAADTVKKAYRKGWTYLSERREELMGRERGKWHHERWYAFGRSQNLTQMDTEKLIIQVTAQRPTVLLDECGFFMTGGGSGPFYGIRPKNAFFPIKYLLAILNSKFFGWIVKTQSTNLRGGYIKFSKQYIETVPIVTPNEAGPQKVAELIALVDDILRRRRQLAAAKTPHEQENLKRQIDATDRQIDKLVYELYGLTGEEIKIVEGE